MSLCPRLPSLHGFNVFDMGVPQPSRGIPSVNFEAFTDVRQIGSGPFKRVYQARWQQPNGGSTEVAIQRIRGSGSSGRREEFEQEVKIFQHLGLHPHLLRLLAITIEPGSCTTAW